MELIRIFAPATVANVSCGFDAMGFAIDQLGDQMVFTKNESKEVSISKIQGAELPFDSRKNAAGAVALAILESNGFPFGVDIQIEKGYKPGSGLGSSAASSAGAAFALNELLGKPYSTLELVRFAMLGEEVACGSQIADNVGAALYGGFVLIRSYYPLDVVSLPTPPELYVTVIHPQVEIKTEDARNILPEAVPMKNAIAQWANVGGLVSGLYTNDYELIGNSLVDRVAEPARKLLIPHFDLLKQTALKAGALGAGISGSGPSVFALSKGKNDAESVATAWKHVYGQTEYDFKLYTSRVGGKGVHIINDL